MPIATRRQAQARSHVTNDGSPAVETPTAQMASRNDNETMPVDQVMEDEAQEGDEDEEVQGS